MAKDCGTGGRASEDDAEVAIGTMTKVERRAWSDDSVCIAVADVVSLTSLLRALSPSPAAVSHDCREYCLLLPFFGHDHFESLRLLGSWTLPPDVEED